MKNSCQDCIDRKIGCHSKCAKYKDYQAKIKEINKNRKEFNKNMNLILKSYKRLYV